MLFAPKEKGQGLVEYALILVLVAVVVIAVLALLGPAIQQRIPANHQRHLNTICSAIPPKFVLMMKALSLWEGLLRYMQ